ncbi:MAG: adenine phosphoribosyltransferase [Candidatus Omnitrophica bacterium]|nr:adenine phosphoribosyltransferase [Candidatus Omnitrophota bacterium]
MRLPIAAVDQDTLKRYIRDIPDFPKPGILFRDITPLLQNGPALRSVLDQFQARYTDQRIEAVVAVESRGLIFGAPLADRLGAGLILVRKAGKLPAKTIRATYALEYGEGTLEVHADSLSSGKRVVLIDDLLATGGTMEAVVKLMEHFRVEIIEVAFLVELAALGGRARLQQHPVFSLVQY